MSWFDSQSVKEKKTTVMNIVAVMLADGNIKTKERNWLRMVYWRVGLSEEELSEILKKPESIKFTAAKDFNDRVKQLVDVVYMMMIDGTIHTKEMDISITIATRLGFCSTNVTNVVNRITEKINQGKDREKVTIELLAFLESQSDEVVSFTDDLLQKS